MHELHNIAQMGVSIIFQASGRRGHYTPDPLTFQVLRTPLFKFTGSSIRFDEIVSTMAANRNPYRQQHIQAEITRDMKMIGSGGKTPGRYAFIFGLECLVQTFLRNQNLAVYP